MDKNISFPNINYDEHQYDNLHKGLFKVIASIIKKVSPKSILDIGAGTGVMYKYVDNFKNIDVYAIDINLDFIKILNERKINAFSCNIEKEDLPNFPIKFDLVIMTGLIEHNLNPKRTFEQIYNSLSQNGTLLLTFPNANSVARRWNHLRGNNPFEPLIDNLFNQEYQKRCSIFYSVADLRKQLRSTFEVVEVSYFQEKQNQGQFKIIILFFVRIISFLFPRFREQTIVLLRKKQI